MRSRVVVHLLWVLGPWICIGVVLNCRRSGSTGPLLRSHRMPQLFWQNSSARAWRPAIVRIASGCPTVGVRMAGRGGLRRGVIKQKLTPEQQAKRLQEKANAHPRQGQVEEHQRYLEAPRRIGGGGGGPLAYPRRGRFDSDEDGKESASSAAKPISELTSPAPKRLGLSPSTSGRSPGNASDGVSHVDGSVADADSQGSPLKAILHCYTTVGSIPPKYLIDILHHLEPVSMAPAALRGLVKKGAKHICKEELLKLWTFITNLDPDSDLPALFHDSALLMQHAKRFNELRGRPARELALPPVWPSIGYCVVDATSKKKAFLKHRVLDKKVVMPAAFLKKVANCYNLVLDKTWSEKLAVARDMEGYVSYNCVRCFPAAEAKESAFTVVLETPALEGEEPQQDNQSNDNEDDDDEKTLSAGITGSAKKRINKKQAASTEGASASSSAAVEPKRGRTRYSEEYVVPPPPPKTHN